MNNKAKKTVEKIKGLVEGVSYKTNTFMVSTRALRFVMPGNVALPLVNGLQIEAVIDEVIKGSATLRDAVVKNHKGRELFRF